VFLTAILVICGFKWTGNNESESSPNTVRIYLKIIEIDGEKHLSMYDSNNPDNVVVDNLYTDVQPGMKVIWKRKLFSGIRQINKIGSAEGERNIFIEDAKIRSLGKGFVLELRDDITGPVEEKYDIVFIDKDDKKTWPIDPFLRIP